MSRKPAGGRVVALELNLAARAAQNPLAEHERKIAQADLLADNRIVLRAQPRAAYRLQLSAQDDRLVLALSDARTRSPLTSIPLTLGSLRRLLPAYWAACEAYYGAAEAGHADELEARDAYRRRLHQEGAAQLQKRLAPELRMDDASARRLFTLLAVLHQPRAAL